MIKIRTTNSNKPPQTTLELNTNVSLLSYTKKEKSNLNDLLQQANSSFLTSSSTNKLDFSSNNNSNNDNHHHRLKKSITESDSDLFARSRQLVDGQNLTKQFLKNRNTIKLFDKVPNEHMPPLHIVNQDEVKKKFLESKIPPVLQFKADEASVQNILFKYNKPSYTHFFKAKHILDLVKSKFTNGTNYFEANFGPRLMSKQCVDIIAKYLTDNKISGDISINFAPGLTCSGRIISYNKTKNNPESRKFAVWINDGEENQFLRTKGIKCLFDHEIGTHYYRSYNDGLQVWYSSRKFYGLRPLSSAELCRTEEGLAALHTVMNANLKFLFLPALFYYIACMADTLTFEQLYNHMKTYIDDPEERWKLVTRVKRGISDPFQIGCYSRDQSYFEGAVNILQNLDSIDFVLLMSGKICVDELPLVKKMARLEKLKLPKFFENLTEYKERLRYIGIVNGIIEPKKKQMPPPTLASVLFVKHDAVTDSDIILENVKPTNNNNYHNGDNDDDDEHNENDIKYQKSFKDIDFEDYKLMYSLNEKCSSLDSNEIKNFINNEIAANSEINVPIQKPLSTNNNSNFCILL